jgi:hypothetical protein
VYAKRLNIIRKRNAEFNKWFSIIYPCK